jgi:hypothetical protein
MARAALALALALTAAAPADARVHRDHRAKAEFKRAEHCPATGRGRGPCPGYVIDHIVPLACGGLDHPSNMQWQTIPEAKAKDRTERIGCSKPR